jgi:peptidoglycan-associated lipoprotein
MYRVALVMLAAMLVLGCSKNKKGADDTTATGEPFDPMADDVALTQDQDYMPGDLPVAGGTGRFGEPGSGLLDPAVDAEARMVLRDIHFAYDSSTILPNDAAILQQIGAFLKRYPNVIIQIEGHCDERGTEEYNMALGSRRANAARQFVADLGIDASRLYTISYGEMRPADPGHTEEAYAKNRRAHFLVGLAGR